MRASERVYLALVEAFNDRRAFPFTISVPPLAVEITDKADLVLNIEGFRMMAKQDETAQALGEFMVTR